jgi:ankyrin repeat protein
MPTEALVSARLTAERQAPHALYLRSIPLALLFLLTLACQDSTSSATIPSTTIYDAIYAENPEIVQQHMDAGTSPNQDPIPEGFPLAGAYPLHLAAIKNNKEIVRILLDNEADINLEAANKDRATPLSWAAFFLQSDMIPLLVQSGALINVIDANKATPLDAAVFSRMMNLADENIRKQADQTIAILKDHGGKSAKDLQK